MQTLLQTLQDHDLGHLKAIAELWGIDLPHGDPAMAASHLAESMLTTDVAEEIIESLPPAAMEALQSIMLHGGRKPLADMRREFGSIRRMGPGKRDREKPWRAPESSTEALWYRGLIATAFADSPSGPREFVFIPTDLNPLLPATRIQPDQVLGGPGALPAKSSYIDLACVQDATTLLAALRQSPIHEIQSLRIQLPQLDRHLIYAPHCEFLVTLLLDLDILTKNPLHPVPSQTGAFLAAPPQSGRRKLFLAWLHSDRWNDLSKVAGLRLVSDRWPNDPVAARQSLLEFLHPIPVDTWWSIEKWVSAIRQWQPSFQRPGADFDSWYIQSETGGEILSGAAHWDQIEGALLRYWISGPLHWLGITQLGYQPSSAHPAAFRLRFDIGELSAPLKEEPPIEIQQSVIKINPKSELRVSQEGSRVARYQVARIGEWLKLEKGDFVYRLSPKSLATAAAQGMTHEHILNLLKKYSQPPIPPSVLEALSRWHQKGVEARLENAILLRLKSPDVVEQLLATKATARFLTNRLNETTFILDGRQATQLIGQAARLGLLIDTEISFEDESG
jgi:hypothetical protein